MNPIKNNHFTNTKVNHQIMTMFFLGICPTHIMSTIKTKEMSIKHLNPLLTNRWLTINHLKIAKVDPHNNSHPCHSNLPITSNKYNNLMGMETHNMGMGIMKTTNLGITNSKGILHSKVLTKPSKGIHHSHNNGMGIHHT